jgi:hypothetical protein
MRISKMIENLQEFKAKYGDIEVWYAEDDEGNGYYKIYFEPALFYVDSDGTVYNDEEEVEYSGVNMDDVKPICVVN